MGTHGVLQCKPGTHSLCMGPTHAWSLKSGGGWRAQESDSRTPIGTAQSPSNAFLICRFRSYTAFSLPSKLFLYRYSFLKRTLRLSIL